MLDGIRDGRPGDQRAFIHKKILGGISKIAGVASVIGIPGAGTVSRVAGAFAGRRTVPRTQTARITQFSQSEKQVGRQLKFTEPQFAGRAGGQRSLTKGGVPCPTWLPWVNEDEFGNCIIGERQGRDLPGGRDVGEAIMGRYGAGLIPGSMPVDRAVCLKGMQLGNDGLCYNKSQISNKQRMWPAGRRPLLTGGDMRAIGIASRAGRRLDLTTKRLQKMGMMKKPAVRRVSTQHQRLLEAHVTK